jgi:hypothetical protein
MWSAACGMKIQQLPQGNEPRLHNKTCELVLELTSTRLCSSLTLEKSDILSYVATSLLWAFLDMGQFTPIWLIEDAATLLRIVSGGFHTF